MYFRLIFQIVYVITVTVVTVIIERALDTGKLNKKYHSVYFFDASSIHMEISDSGHACLKRVEILLEIPFLSQLYAINIEISTLHEPVYRRFALYHFTFVFV